MTLVLQSASIRRLLRVAAGGLLAAVLVSAYGVSHALAEDDDDDLSFEQRILKNILGGVGSGPTGAGIDYRERSPLVIPPSRQLPAPGTPITAAPGSNWPTDPDQQRKKTKAAAAKKGKNVQETLQWYEPGRALTPAELNPGGVIGGSRTTQRGDSPSAAEDGGRALPPSLLGYTGGLFGSIWNAGKPETATFTHEPPRTSLTEPPVGYQTPSPVYPYGINTPKGGPVNRDIETRKKDPAVGTAN